MLNTIEFIKYLKRPLTEDNERRACANINSDNPMGAILNYGAALSKKEFLNDIPEKFTLAHNNGYIHIHDLDFYDMTTTCCQISLDKLFETGFGNMRPPKRISAAFMQLCIAIQSNQNDQYGGQSIIDYDVAMTKVIVKAWETLRLSYDDILAKKIIIDQIEQGCESMIHNLNTMNSRAGAQVPFSSINYGLAPAYFEVIHEQTHSYWAKILIKSTLNATLRGLANGETPRYPIQIYRIKNGVNLNKDDPYYDLTELALKCTAKRAYPNYLFIDNAGNLDGFDLKNPKTHVGTMGCRTRVYNDIFNEENTSYGRGNASFCTINLPRLGILSIDKNEFYIRLNYTMTLAADQLQYRFTRQCKRLPQSYPSLVGDEIGIDAAECKKYNNMWPMLKHFTLSIGFIGLYECLNALKMKGINDITGLEIITFMREKVEIFKKRRKLNYSLLATPAESVCERFLQLDRTRFNILKDITDKDYYTNSFHVPVFQDITIEEKMKQEGPYHRLCNAGHISFVELKDDISNNLEALHNIIQILFENDIGYAALNIPLDHCEDCHFNGCIPTEKCPKCGGENILRMRRITGYLAYLPRFNDGKKAEELDRVKHEWNSLNNQCYLSEGD